MARQEVTAGGGEFANLCWGVACIPSCQERQCYAVTLFVCDILLTQQSLKGLDLRIDWLINRP